MKALIGTKLGMTSIFDETGRQVGATAVEVMPAEVLREKSTDKDGYEAVVVGAGEAKEARVGKSVRGQSKGKARRVLKEFPKDTALGLDQLEAGERVQVSSISKGKGFQGTIKRHNFSRGPMTHGSRNKRRPGSIGGTGAQRVFAGQKMPGRMGNEVVTQRNLRVAAIHAEDNLLLLDGSVPGPAGSLVTITSDAPVAKTEEQPEKEQA